MLNCEDNVQSTRILTAKQVAEEIFGGNKSEWAVGQAVRKNQIPHFRIGKRVFFELNAIQAWAAAEMQKSLQHQAHSSVNGIRRIR